MEQVILLQLVHLKEIMVEVSPGLLAGGGGGGATAVGQAV